MSSERKKRKIRRMPGRAVDTAERTFAIRRHFSEAEIDDLKRRVMESRKDLLNEP